MKNKNLKLFRIPFLSYRLIAVWQFIFYSFSFIAPTQSFAEPTKVPEKVISSISTKQNTNQNQIHVDQQNAVQQIQTQAAEIQEKSEAVDLKKSLEFVVGLIQKKLGKDFKEFIDITSDPTRPYTLTFNKISELSDGDFESIVIGSNSNYEASVESLKFKGITLTQTDIHLLKETAEQKGINLLDFLAATRVSFLDGDHTIHFNFNGKDELVYRFEGHTYVNEDISRNWRQCVREAKGILADDYVVQGYQLGQSDVIVIKRKLTSSSEESHLQSLVFLVNKKSGEPNVVWVDYSRIGSMNNQLMWAITKYFSDAQSADQNVLVTLAKMQVEQSTSKDFVALFDDGNRYQYRLNNNGKIEVEELSKKILPATYDVALKIGENYKVFGPASNDLERGDLIRQAIREMKAGDTLMLGEGRFDCDAKTRGVLVFPDHVTVIGRGSDKTHLFSNSWSDMQGAAYQVKNGTFSDLTFENKTWKLFEDGRTIEMYDGYKRTADNLYYALDENGRRILEEANVGPFMATFDRVKFIGDAWVVYDWSARGNTWIIRDSEIIGGRQGVSMMSSGGHAQNAYILRTKFDIDVMRSMDIGHTSNSEYGGAYGVVARGGNIKVEDSEFYIKGGRTPHRNSYAPRAVGIYDGNDFETRSSSGTSINLIDNRWFIDGNGSQDTFDIFMTNEAVRARLRVSGGYGSNPDGSITRNW